MSVGEYIKTADWDSETGVLKEGEEVTVNGEKTGETFNPNSFWATIVGPDGSEDKYLVKSANGCISSHKRVNLRHRVAKRVSFVGVTGDPLHDSYAYRHFTEREFKWLHKNDVFNKEKITLIANHSDNAAAHFKSKRRLTGCQVS
jgi:hypothetical protein